MAAVTPAVIMETFIPSETENRKVNLDSFLNSQQAPALRNTYPPRGNRRPGRGRGSYLQGASTSSANFPAPPQRDYRQPEEFYYEEYPRQRAVNPAKSRGQSQAHVQGPYNQQVEHPFYQPVDHVNYPVNGGTRGYPSRGRQAGPGGYFQASQGNVGRGRGGDLQRGRFERPYHQAGNQHEVDWQRGAPVPGNAPDGHRNEQPRTKFGNQDVRGNIENDVKERNGMGNHLIGSAPGSTRSASRGGDDDMTPRNIATRSGVSGGGVRKKIVKVEDQNQRERLTEELTKERLECQFCYERIWTKQPTWSCEGCFNVFHLKCLRGWATTCKNESQDGTWRCMICQVILLDEPRQYLCFCRKQENPDWNPNITPHSCGVVCGKGSAKGNAGLGCEHPCVCLCHPGPCPPCQRLISKSCGCGKTQIQDQCASTCSHVCSNVCDKPLGCSNHTCKQMCHVGPCADCTVSVEKSCHCGREVRLLSCLESTSSTIARGFACTSICGRKLKCGNHCCDRICHAGECSPCSRSPALVTKCQCGKHSLRELSAAGRKNCLDPIMGCGEICEKVLSCGTAKNSHLCERDCHDGPCPHCDKKTAVNCCCGSSTQVVACADLTPEIRMWKCPKKCQKKMICSRHRCENVCCSYDEHICWKQCQKKLTCGLHACEDPCGHPGGCRRCLNTSFEERTCTCGFTIQHPPILCGAPLPECKRPCSRDHACGHPPTHVCHGDVNCPPCTFLCEKTCFGGHENRRNIPCHVQGLSCGKSCLKQLDCGVHSCKKMCHAGECQMPGEKCLQLCTQLYRKCGHPCSVVCHGASKCPVTPCKSAVEVTCECRLKKEKIVCHQHEKLLKEYLKRKQVLDLGTKLKLDDLRYAMPVDVLECDDECRKVERNKNLASALNIDPDTETVSATGPPVYGEPLKQAARENIRWATQIENSIITLVKTVKETGASRRVHQLQPMKHEQRKFVHELAEFYGCTTQSFDQEPVRAVVLIAKADAVMTPSTPLYLVVAAERPAKQSAKCPASLNRSAALNSGMNIAEKGEKFTWPVELPSVNGMRNLGQYKNKNKSVPTVDYFDVTD